MSSWYFAAAIVLFVVPAPLTGQVAPDGVAGPVVSPYSATFASASAIPLPANLVAAEEATDLVQPQLRNRSGRVYMIAGVAAFIGGLLIDGDVGTLIAAGGVVMGVYGILLYY